MDTFYREPVPMCAIFIRLVQVFYIRKIAKGQYS